MEVTSEYTSHLFTIIYLIGSPLCFQVLAQANSTTFGDKCNHTTIMEGPIRTPKAIANCSILSINGTADYRYTLLNGSYNGIQIFRISEVGVVYQESEVDREKVSYFLIFIYVTSSDGKNSSVQLNIFVDDINDNPPVIFGNNTLPSISLSHIMGQSSIEFQIMAQDIDSGENSILEYTLTYTQHYINGLADVVSFLINVSDNGEPPLSTVAFKELYIMNGRCPVQKHTVNASSGVITSLFLCNVMLVSNKTGPLSSSNKTGPLLSNSSGLFEGDNVTMYCLYISNVDILSFKFINNNKIATASTNPFLIIMNVTIFDGGTYKCEIESSIGKVLSDDYYLLVQGK